MKLIVIGIGDDKSDEEEEREAAEMILENLSPFRGMIVDDPLATRIKKLIGLHAAGVL